ncbi:MAG TPA: glutathione S-transferase family protein [Steroidobacteraceae bacterium]|nr:glutathione S-transferase family protein [Steroidobacteraceae bacterium]
MIELYHSEPNTYYLKPLIALKEARAPFESRYFDPTSFEQFSPSFPQNSESRLNLEREGPTLVDGVTVLSSSFFMLEYIAEAFPAANLCPGDAYGRYRARAWGQFIALQLAPAVCTLGCAKYLSPALQARDVGQLVARIERIEPQERREAWMACVDGRYDAAALATVRQGLEMPVKRIEDALGRGAWLAGPQYSIADVDAFAMLNPLTDLAPEVVSETATPQVVQFLRRVRDRQGVQQALALARTAKPHEAFVPGAEPSRWG